MDISQDEIDAFKSSVLARRFPGLKSMSEDDLKRVIYNEKKKAGQTYEKPKKTYPKTNYEIPEVPKRNLVSIQPAPFVPISPSSAKTEVMRAPQDSFIGVGTPYDSDKVDLLEDRANDESKRATSNSFVPSSASKAKDAIRADYYLYSADEKTKQAELNATRMRSTTNTALYNELYNSRRGKTLI